MSRTRWRWIMWILISFCLYMIIVVLLFSHDSF